MIDFLKKVIFSDLTLSLYYNMYNFNDNNNNSIK